MFAELLQSRFRISQWIYLISVSNISFPRWRVKQLANVGAVMSVSCLCFRFYFTAKITASPLRLFPLHPKAMDGVFITRRTVTPAEANGVSRAPTESGTSRPVLARSLRLFFPSGLCRTHGHFIKTSSTHKILVIKPP